ncbi:tripartite tricarboxylate transporter substrate binding protein [Bradyrhizobium sp. LHD-71]|uniref:Bug family tripartite tricarboxylate transporter substrate binding protein n=1 Tax=Bradyrhizobium sp. LHD-71 TaxID=3072141 RepID=UPI00280DAA2E|nr:tripartite tricarboxylate transporter substrate binding protein [Bradyrhizobium sp. LHD-71]MDQ8732354.1 tripartite tricarboxylate transporter substrate binding protein [Bradyrhizobium sp. LHD-71]
MSMHVGVSRRRVSAWLAAAAMLPFVPVRGGAQETYPNRVIKIVVPWSPGAITDVTARLIAQHWTKELSQPVIVENKAGASGTLGHQAVAQAPADGYTVLIGTNSTYAIAPSIIDPLPYDNDKAFAPVGLMLQSPQMLCVHPSVPAKTFPELLDYARARPNVVNFGSAGIGATSHLAMELMMSMARVRMEHIPYRGGGPAQQALIAGEVSVGFVDAVIAVSSAEAGLLRMLGASTTERLKLAPNVPTIAETVPGFQSTTDVAMFVRTGTPEPIIRRLHAAMTEALKAPTVTEPLLKAGAIIVGGSPEAFPAYFAAESGKWRELIKARNITLR